MSDFDTPTFRPMGTGALFDATFRFYARCFKTLAGITLICHLPTLLTTAAGVYLVPTIDPKAPDPTLGYIFFVQVLLGSVTTCLMAGALTQLIRERYLGRELTAAEALGRAFSCFGKLFTTQWLAGLWIGLGFLCLFIPGIIWSFTLCMAVPVVMLEGLKNSEALSRSKKLVQYNRSKVVGLVMGFGILKYILVYAMAYAWGYGISSLSSGFVVELANRVGGAVIGVLVAPLTSIALVLLYYDLRIQHEAFDLEMLSATMEPT